MQDLKLIKLWLVIGWLLIALVWFLSLTSSPVPDMGIDNGDKLGHFIAYAVLMGWFAQIYTSISKRLLLVFGFILMGVAIEYVQGMTEYRSFQYMDMVEDGLGVLLAFVATHGPLASLLVRFEKRFISPD